MLIRKPKSRARGKHAGRAWQWFIFAAVLRVCLGDASAGSNTNQQEHWSFRPLRRPSIPAVEKRDWARNPIDEFVLARLEKEGLQPSVEADKVTLIRRLYFNLAGLPPSPEDVERFVEDDSSSAYEIVVERLLGSLQYGERWARHWLDVVRFAESNGFETNTERPNAWPYRDYVIRAFNQDKPYDRFVLEQLAGDALGVQEATGFLVAGPYDAVKSPDINLTLQQRMDELNDMISTTSGAFLGLTVACARCHNHKFDPILQTDYYSMQAIFAGVQHGERTLLPPDSAERLKRAELERKRIAQIDEELSAFEPLARAGANSGPGEPLRPAVNPRLNVERFAPLEAKYVRFTILETAGGSEPCLDELEVYAATNGINIALATAGTKATASGTYSGSEFHKLEHINDGRVGNSRSWISNEPGKGWVQLEFANPARVQRIVWGRDREGKYQDRLAVRYRIEAAAMPGQWKLAASSDDREPYVPAAKDKNEFSLAGLTAPQAARAKELLAERKRREQEVMSLTTFPAVYAGRFEQPGMSYRLQRGEPLQKREQVPPAAVHGLGPELSLPVDTPEQARRLALARWITTPENPLTARVLVNRLWQYHFGEGIVSTPSDFGHMGAQPTHPELLDWLATELVAHRWSIKHLQRLIVLSSTFRQSSRPNPKGISADAGSRLLWRFPPQRLEAEPIRDAILAVSGNLDLRMGGRGFDLFEPNSNYVKVYNPKEEFGPVEWRRMIYQSKPRMRLDDIFGAFDCPDAGQAAPRRTVSTTPLQALNLLNSTFMLEQSEIFAKRLEKEAGPDPAREVERAFDLAFNRQATAAEERAAVKLVRDEGLKIFCRALFNANEFIYLF